MSLLGVHDVTLAFGGPPVLDGVGFHVEAGERVALIGRNGSGKSTLLKVLAGDHLPDRGEVTFAPGRRIARLPQEVPRDLHGEVLDVVASGVPEVGALLAEYHRLSHALSDGDSKALDRLEAVQHRLEASGGWALHQKVETVLSRLQLPETGRFETLSGGMSRRVLLARALVAEPDVLLLDEPTNHLDIPAIEWLEELILGMGCAVVFVTHDRAFLRRLATRILELDRGRLSDYPGDWRRYQERKADLANAEAKARDRFDKKLAQEEAWIRQGIKARRTRNEGRVRSLEAMREAARQRRSGPGSARLTVDDGGRSGKRVIVAKHLDFSWGEQVMVRDFSTTVMRGDKVGLLGPNGSGKTTLLRLLLGELQPTGGEVRHGTNLEIAYFDQLREALDPAKSVADNVADGADKISIGGKPRHVISYLADFLFSPEQTRGPVDALSGGERNRLLLARLFTRPFNLLVMDEPTNDLDVETLELLEARLVDLDATLLLVSHDREFLDRVVSSTLVMEGDGRVGDYAGGYSDWLRQRPEPVVPRQSKPKAEQPAATRAKPASKPKKLSYKEQRDLDALPGRIEALEGEQQAIHALLADPETYKSGLGSVVADSQARLAVVEAELETAYDRWAELEERVS